MVLKLALSLEAKRQVYFQIRFEGTNLGLHFLNTSQYRISSLLFEADSSSGMAYKRTDSHTHSPNPQNVYVIKKAKLRVSRTNMTHVKRQGKRFLVCERRRI